MAILADAIEVAAVLGQTKDEGSLEAVPEILELADGLGRIESLYILKVAS